MQKFQQTEELKMEENKILEKENALDEQAQSERADQLNTIVGDIILENKKRGSITTDELLDKLEKYQATPNELEDVYKMLEESGIQVINEYERDKELYDQLISEVSMDDPVKMYLKDIGKVPLLQPDEETELA